MPLHFLDDATADAAVGDVVRIGGAEAHHAAAVRRVRVGERITLGDGAGVWLDGECTHVQPREVTVRVTARREVPAPSPPLVLVQALAKTDRAELAVQAATELGADGIVPWQAARSVSRWDAAKAEKGRARWQAIAREAAKQAHRAWVPQVAAPTTTAQLCELAASARVIVLEPTAAAALTRLPLDDADPREILLVVGPEGGIADQELSALEAAGAQQAALGSHVLRTSTAGPAALAVLSMRLRRW